MYSNLLGNFMSKKASSYTLTNGENIKLNKKSLGNVVKFISTYFCAMIL